MANKELELKIFSENEGNLPPGTMSVWATGHDIQAILPDGVSPDDQPNYVKITSLNPLTKFTLYAKINRLNGKTQFSDGKIYVPYSLMHRTWTYDNGMEVEISYLDVNSLPRVQSLEISLKPSEVISWSEEEEESAKSLFLAKTTVVYQSQMVLIKPTTKDSVIGEVTHLYPTAKEHNLAYRIDRETGLRFVGLPDNKQKTIDFSKIGGLDAVIKRLREIIQIPLNFPELLQRFGITPPKGMILYGPPGNGKTMIARAIAHSMGASFVEIDLSDLLSKYVGESEQKLKDKFNLAAAKPNSVIFIDEIDAVASARSEKSESHQVSLISTLLVEMDGINSCRRVFVIGATNRLDAVDPALRRPGRFDLEFEVPLPDVKGRLDVLRKYVPMNKPELLEASVDNHTLVMLSEMTSGYSGADMSMLYREAVMHAIRRNMKFDDAGKIALGCNINDVKLKCDDFIMARKEITPTQMRGELTIEETAKWDNIVGLDSQKDTLQEIDALLAKCIDSDMLQNRPTCANLLMVGRRGTGKRTLTTAFAKKFGYEMMSIDCVELESLLVGEALQEIHRVLIKCRQSAPSILFVQNIDTCQNKEVFARKVINELSRLNKRLKVLAVVTAEDAKQLPAGIRGYKAFENEINLDVDEMTILEGIKVLFPTIEVSGASVAGKTIGQAIRDQREKMLLLDNGKK